MEDGLDEEVANKKRTKVPLSELPGALPPVLWSSSRPRPELSPGVWDNEQAEELAKYIDWHRNHPHSVTPRKAKVGPDGDVIGGKLVHEDDPTLVYSLNGIKESYLPPQFYPSSLGTNCDTDEVSTIAMRHAYTEQLLYNEQHDDPWYSMSVKDQLETSHIDGSHTTNKFKPKASPAQSSFDKELAWKMEEYGDYQGGAPPIFSQDRRGYVDKLSLNDKLIIHGERQRKSPWEQEPVFSRYTNKGTALNDFRKVELERKVDIALLQYEEDARALRRMESRSQKSSKPPSSSSSSASPPPSRSQKVSRKALSKVAPLPAPLDMYDEMKTKLGGQPKMEKMAQQWVDLGTQVAKKSKKQKDLFDFKLDLIEACERLQVAKVLACLVASNDPNIQTPDDEPLFLTQVNRALKMDNVTGNTRVGDEKKDPPDRKKLQRILDLFIKFKVEIDDDRGKDQLSPIHLAVIADNVKVLHWLLVHNGDKELRTRVEQMTPVMLAAKYGHVHVMGELIRQGADVHAVETETTGWTALHYAAAYGQTRAALFLMRIGAKKKQRDLQNRTAAQIAFDKDYQATAQAISAFAEPAKLIAPQLEYIVEQEEKKNNKRVRRAAVTADSATATLTAMARNAMQLVHSIGQAMGKAVDYVFRKLHLQKERDTLDDLQEIEDGDDDSVGQIEGGAPVINAANVPSVVALARQSPGFEPRPQSDDVMAFE